MMNTFHPSAVLRERMRQREKERVQREKALDVRIRWVKRGGKAVKVNFEVFGDFQREKKDCF